ncbi:MAG: adenosylmethionine-8-amino-7-oxononanoate aminotransferase [Halothiobacillaceae bacterium]|nr:MAG: adenosylmethionine-8-amino-7-oxononanoate aminotransferase [Halothiobacillaceae bacterium]
MNSDGWQNLLNFDRDHIWHPYASMPPAQGALLVTEAHGVKLTLADGQQLIDGMASWWAAIHGYNHPMLNQAVQQQLAKMAHVMFGGLTHPPAIALAKKLLEITPTSLQRVFLADSGSVAVEVALKMALQYWQALGQPRKQKFLTLRHGYHGDTFGAMAVCDPINGMHHLFSGLLPQHLFAAAPPNLSEERPFAAALESFSSLIEQHHPEIAAVILEPIVQGAGGMRIYDPSYLTAVRRLATQYEIPLILDEIATGFGRTGSLFAYEQAGIEPDILCLGKALTGGYMTLAATLTTAKISDIISQASPGALMHGPTFMANPLACAVALASIELLLASPWQTRIRAIETQLHDSLSRCKSFPQVADVRILGAIGVIEMQRPVNVQQIQQQCIARGIWIRPFGRLIYIMPPYIISADELETLTSAIVEIVKQSK